MIQTSNPALVQRYSTYVVATKENVSHLEMAPFGLSITSVFDPQKMASAQFLDLLQKLDGLTFGPEGMPMDKWVFYNCAELPGFIYGFATPVEDLNEDERSLYQVPSDYRGMVPLSMYIAIPMHEPGHWFGHNLASVNSIVPHRHLEGLGTMTKALAVKAFGIKHFVGATQWTSKALRIHCRFGPLDLYTTYTPAHSIPETLTYGFEVTDEKIRAALGDPEARLTWPAPTQNLFADDIEGMLALQLAIEKGQRYQLVAPPKPQGERIMHSVRNI